MEMKTVSSRDELLSEVDKLSQEGWTAVRVDEPEKAVVSYIAFREPVSDDGPEQEVAWPFLGRILDPVLEDVEPDVYLEALNQDGAVVADNPKELRFGVALYDLDKGVSRVIRISIRQVKKLGKERLELVWERKRVLIAAWKERFPDPYAITTQPAAQPLERSDANTTADPA